jgi:hypothetical protein
MRDEINEEMRAIWIPQSNSQTQAFGDFGRASEGEEEGQ